MNTDSKAAGLLQDCANQLVQLAELMEEEHRILQHRNPAELGRCMERKQELLDKVEKAAHACQDIFREIKIGERPATQACKKIISQMEILLGKCRHQNGLNGKIIEISHQFNQRMLEIMLGGPPSTPLYNPHGKNLHRKAAQTLAKI